jgi:hypothetical protein
MISKHRKNILVFPCGSEIALEIYRSLKFSTHFNLIGGSSVDDHGRFIYENYIGGIPFVTDPIFIQTIKKIVKDNNIDAIYPAMDKVIVELKKHEAEIGCKVISSDLRTVKTCLSKKKTYEKLKSEIKVPKLFNQNEVKEFPVFGKPDVGYGSRGVKKIDSRDSLDEFILNNPKAIVCEYLPGDEYTVDCITDKKGQLLFYAPRVRKRIMNGISVNTIPYSDENEKFHDIITAINAKLKPRGAWFVQLKKNTDGELVLLEVAARLGGSSSLFRAKGVNFAQMTLFDAFNYDISVVENNYNIELDRALDTVFKIDMRYGEVFCDLDDCLIIDKKYVNTELVAFLYQCLNDGVKITLLTKHRNDINKTLKRFRLAQIFDRILHIEPNKKKSDYIDNKDSIFIDDSFAERAFVKGLIGIPVFGIDMVRGLLR